MKSRETWLIPEENIPKVNCTELFFILGARFLLAPGLKAALVPLMTAVFIFLSVK